MSPLTQDPQSKKCLLSPKAHKVHVLFLYLDHWCTTLGKKLARLMKKVLHISSLFNLVHRAVTQTSVRHCLSNVLCFWYPCQSCVRVWYVSATLPVYCNNLPFYSCLPVLCFVCLYFCLVIKSHLKHAREGQFCHQRFNKSLYQSLTIICVFSCLIFNFQSF